MAPFIFSAGAVCLRNNSEQHFGASKGISGALAEVVGAAA
jgi:hypothetical protein